MAGLFGSSLGHTSSASSKFRPSSTKGLIYNAVTWTLRDTLSKKLVRWLPRILNGATKSEALSYKFCWSLQEKYATDQRATSMGSYQGSREPLKLADYSKQLLKAIGKVVGLVTSARRGSLEI
jgi:hypothetical protein